MMSAKAEMKKLVKEKIDSLEELKITGESLGLATMGLDTLIERVQATYDRWVEVTEELFSQL